VLSQSAKVGSSAKVLFGRNAVRFGMAMNWFGSRSGGCEETLRRPKCLGANGGKHYGK
jgi:hypothetical protein